MSGGHSRIRDGHFTKPQFRERICQSRLVQVFDGVDRGRDPLAEKALRLTPRGPFVDTLYLRIGTAHLPQSHYEDAIRWLKKARNATPWPAEVRSYLASAYALTGETEHAAAELAEARRLSPDDRYSSIARLRAVEHYGASKIRDLREATYFAGLRKAGMPEE